MINEFFASPNINLGLTGNFSVLYLLRRDIFTCYGIYPDDNRVLVERALWPGAMGVLAGIDLLGKFYVGSDDITGGGPRFRQYIIDNFSDLNPKDEEVIYQLRNALLHSFGLYSRNRAGKEYIFALQARGETLVTELGSNKYAVDIVKLWTKFEESIGTYYGKLVQSEALKLKFESIVPKYGWVFIGDRDPDNHSTSGFSPL